MLNMPVGQNGKQQKKKCIITFFTINIPLTLLKCLMRNNIYFYNIHLTFKNITKSTKHVSFFLHAIFIKTLFWIHVIMGLSNACICYRVSARECYIKIIPKIIIWKFKRLTCSMKQDKEIRFFVLKQSNTSAVSVFLKTLHEIQEEKIA